MQPRSQGSLLHERDPEKRWSRVSQIMGDYKRQHGGRGCHVRSLSVLSLPRHEDYMHLVCVTRSKCPIFRRLKLKGRFYAPSGHVNLSCCRLCKSVGDNISHSKNLFAKNNRALIASVPVEELYGRSLSQNELLQRLVCKPCEKRVNNFKAFKNMIMETPKFLERTHFSVNLINHF